jgi:hypothetical protein
MLATLVVTFYASDVCRYATVKLLVNLNSNPVGFGFENIYNEYFENLLLLNFLV